MKEVCVGARNAGLGVLVFKDVEGDVGLDFCYLFGFGRTENDLTNLTFFGDANWVSEMDGMEVGGGTSQLGETKKDARSSLLPRSTELAQRHRRRYKFNTSCVPPPVEVGSPARHHEVFLRPRPSPFTKKLAHASPFSLLFRSSLWFCCTTTGSAVCVASGVILPTLT